MKFTRKLFSIVSAMSMAACVFASPVFADDSTESSSEISNTDSDSDILLEPAALETSTVDENADKTADSSSGSSTETDKYEASSYVELVQMGTSTANKPQYFKYDSQTKKITSRFRVIRDLPTNLIYQISSTGINAAIAPNSAEAQPAGRKLADNEKPKIIVVDDTEDNEDIFQLSFTPEALKKGDVVDVTYSVYFTGSKDPSIKLSATAWIDHSEDKELSGVTDIVDLDKKSDDNDSSADNSTSVAKDLKFTDVEYSAKDNTLSLNLKVPASVVSAKEALTAEIMGIASSGLSNVKLDELDGLSSAEIQEALLKQITSNTKLLESLESIRIGKGTSYKEYKGSEISSWVTKETGINSYSIEIPGANLNSDISFIFKTNADQSVVENASVLAWAHSKSAVSQIYAGKIVADKDPDSPYLITAGYTANDSSDTAKRNPYGLHISDKATDALNPFADTNATSVLTITSDPNVLTGITDFSIGKVNYSVIEDATNGITITKKNGTETAPVDSQTPAGDDASDTENEAGENALSAKKTNNGYEIVIPNSDLAGLGKDEYIDFLFSTKPDLTTATINVNVASSNGQYTGSFSQQIKGGSGNTSNPGTNGGTSSETGNPISQNAAFKASHNYDSATQTWTVTLNMTGRPPKLDLTFNQKEGTALLKPNSFTINNAAVSPTVNATMSGSKMSVCTVSFSQDDLAKVGSGSVVKLVFPVDGSKEQTEKITMTVATGNASKDLNATFTVKKTTNGGVPTATETGAQPMIIVLVIALIALAVFGFLAFRKKKK